MPGDLPGLPRGSPGHPPGIPRGSPGDAPGEAGPGGPPGDFFGRSPQVPQSCHIGLGSKRWALVSTKRHFWFIGFFWADTPINLLELGPTYCPEIVEGITKMVIQAPRECKTRKHFPKCWPEIVEGITKNVIQEFRELNQRQAAAVNVSHLCLTKWCPDRVPEPPFFTRRGPR